MRTYLPELDWMADAECVGVDPDLFFPVRGGDTASAKAICHDCPVRVECLDYAVTEGIKHGVFGGKSERERRHLRRLRLVVAP